jgi:hypothetical protein
MEAPGIETGWFVITISDLYKLGWDLTALDFFLRLKQCLQIFTLSLARDLCNPEWSMGSLSRIQRIV